MDEIMQEVTDPTILERLNSGRQPVVDPAILARLNQTELTTPWGAKYPRLAAIPATALEMAKTILPFGKYLGEEGRSELKGDFFPTGTTTDPEKLKEIESGLTTGQGRVSPYESLAGEVGKAIDWAGTPMALKTVGAVAEQVLPKAVTSFFTKPISKLITDSVWYRKMTIPERGLVTQSVDDLIAKGHSEGEILRKWGTPEFRQEALSRRMQGEVPAPEVAPQPSGMPPEVGIPTQADITPKQPMFPWQGVTRQEPVKPVTEPLGLPLQISPQPSPTVSLPFESAKPTEIPRERITGTAILMKDGTIYTRKDFPNSEPGHAGLFYELSETQKKNVSDISGYVTEKGRYLTDQEARDSLYAYSGRKLEGKTDASEIVGKEFQPGGVQNVPTLTPVTDEGTLARLGEPLQTGAGVSEGESNAKVSLVLKDGTVLLGGNIHPEVYNLAVSKGIPEDALSSAKSGFTRPDGSTFDLQGKEYAVKKVVDLQSPTPPVREGKQPWEMTDEELEKVAIGGRIWSGPSSVAVEKQAEKVKETITGPELHQVLGRVYGKSEADIAAFYLWDRRIDKVQQVRDQLTRDIENSHLPKGFRTEFGDMGEIRIYDEQGKEPIAEYIPSEDVGELEPGQKETNPFSGLAFELLSASPKVAKKYGLAQTDWELFRQKPVSGKTVTPPVKESLGEGKQPWEMTRDEILTIQGDPLAKTLEGKVQNVEELLSIRERGSAPDKKSIIAVKKKQIAGLKNQIAERESQHKLAIQQALSEGKSVPPEVLKDYPELGKVTKPKTTEEAYAKGRALTKDEAVATWEEYKHNIAKPMDKDPQKASDIGFDNQLLKETVEGYLGNTGFTSLTAKEIELRLKRPAPQRVF